MLPILALPLNVYDPLQELPFVPRPSVRRDHCFDFELVFTELLVSTVSHAPLEPGKPKE